MRKGKIVVNDLSRIKVSIIIFILINSIFIFSGCSFIMLENKFMPTVDESKWRKVRVYQHFYNLNAQVPRFVFEYKNNDFTITIPAYYDKDKCGISLGPWLLPILPTFPSCFFLTEKKDFNFKFIVENYGDPFTIDIQGTKLIKSGGQVVTPSNVSYMAPRFNYPYTDREKYWFYYPATDMKTYSSPVTIEKSGMILFSIDYTNIDRNEEFKIEFGKISSIEKFLNLPQINIKSGNVILFCPIVLVGHEPCFIND